MFLEGAEDDGVHGAGGAGGERSPGKGAPRESGAATDDEGPVPHVLDEDSGARLWALERGLGRCGKRRALCWGFAFKKDGATPREGITIYMYQGI